MIRARRFALASLPVFAGLALLLLLAGCAAPARCVLLDATSLHCN